MVTQKSFPWYLVAMVAGGVLLSLGKLDLPDVPEWGKWFQEWKTPFVVTSIEGSTLILVNEKTTPTVDQTLDVRRAAEFVKEHKLRGYLNVDQDDEWIKTTLVTLSEKPGNEPPLLIAATVVDNKVSKVIRARKWTKIEDILK